MATIIEKELKHLFSVSASSTARYVYSFPNRPPFCQKIVYPYPVIERAMSENWHSFICSIPGSLERFADSANITKFEAYVTSVIDKTKEAKSEIFDIVLHENILWWFRQRTNETESDWNSRLAFWRAKIVNKLIDKFPTQVQDHIDELVSIFSSDRFRAIRIEKQKSSSVKFPNQNGFLTAPYANGFRSISIEDYFAECVIQVCNNYFAWEDFFLYPSKNGFSPGKMRSSVLETANAKLFRQFYFLCPSSEERLVSFLTKIDYNELGKLEEHIRQFITTNPNFSKDEKNDVLGAPLFELATALCNSEIKNIDVYNIRRVIDKWNWKKKEGADYVDANQIGAALQQAIDQCWPSSPLKKPPSERQHAEII